MAKSTDFYTQYKRPEKNPEINSGEMITDQIHIPISALLKDFREAGIRLQDERAKYYHDKFGNDEMTDFVPPNPSADPVMRDAYLNEVTAKLRAKMDKVEKELEDARKSKGIEVEEAGSAQEPGPGEPNAKSSKTVQEGA